MADALNDLLRQLALALASQRALCRRTQRTSCGPHWTALKPSIATGGKNAVDEVQRGAAFGRLHDRLDRASRLVHQLLTLARHESYDPSLEFEAVDLHQLAQQVVSDFYLLAERKQIDLGVEAGEEMQAVYGNPDDIRIVLSNLVDNAIRYTPAGGRIDIDTVMVDGCIALRVADDGPGIPAARRSRVFDRFYRSDEPQAWGSGLGLAIVKKNSRLAWRAYSIDRYKCRAWPDCPGDIPFWPWLQVALPVRPNRARADDQGVFAAKKLLGATPNCRLNMVANAPGLA